MNRADNIGTILALLLLGQLLIPLIEPDVKAVENQVEQAIESYHIKDEVEEVRHLVLRVLLFRQVPEPTHRVSLVDGCRLRQSNVSTCDQILSDCVDRGC